ncbi:Alpha carbonic anhydrase domain superfamily [Arabidopsis suecica]|uniref:Carbonic anhydrase n=1 Tax=Arabidopsis suecica TaxID=45249 RepID=A0A8T2EG75_ARASU|nr:Alpha carbonic anhydrase domain superfamily [Arabidopsis suecica]
MDANTKTILFFVVFFIDLFSPNILLVYAREIGNKPLFTYKQKTEKGPAEWGKLDPQWKVCSTGKIQSPIDLTDERVSLIHDQALSKHYKPASAVIQSRGHDVMVSWKGDGGKITIHQTDYKLVQCHWHSPSEHTINGTSYDLELHMVHTSASGKTTVVGVLYKLGEPDEFLTKILNGIKGVGKKEIDLGIVDPRDIRFETNNFYRYIGSLTIPPCTEGVIWTVQKRVLYFFCFCYRLIIFVTPYINIFWIFVFVFWCM